MRATGAWAAITPSTNPAATPANKIINALKGRNAIIIAPSPMGFGTCGRNNFSDNMNYRHYLNITRVVRKIPERIPSEQEIFGDYLRKFR